MTILEVCEPLFQYVCYLNMLGRKGGEYTFQEADQSVQNLFHEIRRKVATDQQLYTQFQMVEMALIFFVDAAIVDSTLPFAGEWDKNRLAYRMGQMAGDKKFFDLLDDVLKQHSKDATDSLYVFYTCLTLGFTGVHQGQYEKLQSLMWEIADRLQTVTDLDQNAKLCPAAYENVDTRNFNKPIYPGLLKFLKVACVLLLVFLVYAIIHSYFEATAKLRDAFRTISAKAPSNNSKVVSTATLEKIEKPVTKSRSKPDAKVDKKTK